MKSSTRNLGLFAALNVAVAFGLTRRCAVDEYEHGQYSGAIERVDAVGAQLREAILAVRYGTLTQYDPIVTNLVALERGASVLSQRPSFLDDTDWVDLWARASFVLLVLAGVLAISRLRQTAMSLDKTKRRLQARILERTRELDESSLALRVSEARTAAFIDAALDAFLSFDADGTIVQFNPAAEYMFEMHSDAAVGANIRSLVLLPDANWGPEQSEDWSTKLERAVNHRLEVFGRRLSGAEFPAEVTITPISTGGSVHYAACVRDLTTQTELQRIKREFVSTVSHELRTPLTAIRGSLGLIAGGVAGELPPKVEELIEIATANSERLMRLVNDILDLERIEAKKVPLQKERLRANDLVREAVCEMMGMAEEAGVRLESRIDDAPQIEADRERMLQVLGNLISNAVKFSESKDSVEIAVGRANGAWVRFAVSDQGPGIPTRDQERVFEKFRQLDGSDTRAKGGTGLGLAIAKAIVEQHEGRIGVTSTLGEGTTFHFDLPAAGTPS